MNNRQQLIEEILRHPKNKSTRKELEKLPIGNLILLLHDLTGGTE